MNVPEPLLVTMTEDNKHYGNLWDKCTSNGEAIAIVSQVLEVLY